jgi:BolA protein
MEKIVPVEEKIRYLLHKRFNPTHLTITDESHKHAGHHAAPSGGQSHFHISITANEFTTLDKLGRQRAIYEELDQLLRGPIHALSIRASAPEEL